MMAPPIDLSDALILVVDDKPANVQLLQLLLAQAGYQKVNTCTDPLAVCALHQKHHYDLILLDLQMPGMDGFEVMAGLRDIEPDGYMPVLAITVHPKHKLRALKAGAKDFIVKPFDLVELQARIKNHLEVRLLYKKLAHAVGALESYALHDALTGLPNRRLLLEQLKQGRQSSTQTLEHGALMFMDLDQFKTLNDTLGHDVGDVLLQQAAQRLLQCVREGDSVARFGGDEFVVLLGGLSQDARDASHQAQKVANQILTTLAQTYDLDGHAYDSTISVGIATFLGDGENTSNLLKMADLAMYRAKSLGRNQVCLFDPAMQAELYARDRLLKDLHHALRAEEFVLFYQVQLNAAGVPIGAEALLRWNHAKQGMLLPAQFLALAEESKLILPLARWVLKSACAQLLLWAKDPLRVNWTLTVNVGPLQLAQTDFVEQVAQALSGSGASAQRLTLELTEDTLRNDIEDVITKMQALHTLGVGFSLDNFGAGFASLIYLRRLPLNRLKVDQPMVQAALQDTGVAVIATAIVALGACLSLPVLAGGIETAAQFEYFAKLGCTSFQGHYFAAAQAADVLCDLYEQNVL
ncbi:MAG: EAL domain-containing protein [Rhodoferax sp.]|jgi:diguanylate cyclase (GGDEF)-like protein|uniref:GGDEF/EAL domain-containing response regulator n=1 Tax=Rhodoferax sp. TaxID=50421 RepID=UPI001B5C3935|nr:EAL domain-containing protein [Rhodoferax sp.]MBP8285916.1 EAL domain-containing protein [Rhodoferax sp.]MBP9735685.1 EAL domain-containing protein [Rhodoferax sp.]